MSDFLEPECKRKVSVTRKKTLLQREVSDRRDATSRFISRHMSKSFSSGSEDSVEETVAVDSYIPLTLKGALFCGHIVTDMDSVAGAIGAAELYGGVPASASAINSETKFCLEKWGVPVPTPIEELLASHPSAGVCLVDHQQTSQLNKAINVDRIVGVIDHHALQNSTIVTDHPIYIDIRPWGSMSTIIAHTFATLGRRPKTSTAGMLLCAILSDTLNLQGPTTTEWDKLMVSVLVQIAGVTDVQQLASDQFKAKSSELAFMTPAELCNGDQKAFSFKTELFEGSVGFAVIETTDDDVIMSRATEILIALQHDKENKKHSVLFLAVVNIVKLRSKLLMLGPAEKSLALTAFSNGKIRQNAHGEEFIMDLGGLVSRKKDFIPAVTAAVQKGWAP